MDSKQVKQESIPGEYKEELSQLLMVEEPILRRGWKMGLVQHLLHPLVCHFRLLEGCLWNISSPVVKLNCGITKKLRQLSIIGVASRGVNRKRGV